VDKALINVAMTNRWVVCASILVCIHANPLPPETCFVDLKMVFLSRLVGLRAMTRVLINVVTTSFIPQVNFRLVPTLEAQFKPFLRPMHLEAPARAETMN